MVNLELIFLVLTLKPLLSTTMQLKQINEYVVLNLDYYKEPIPS